MTTNCIYHKCSLLVAALGFCSFCPSAFAAPGMVAATFGASDVRAGYEVLQSGGTSIDAALTTAIGQVVSSGGSFVSYAGVLSLVYYDSSNRKVYFLDAGYSVPRAEMDALSIPERDSGRTSLVPGFMAGVEAAHRKFGKLTFARLFEQAIQRAEEGIVVDAQFDAYFQLSSRTLKRLPESRNFARKDDGTFYRRGETWRQPILAKTLRKVSADGAAYMYSGEWGQKFVEIARREGSRISLDDLKSYAPSWNETLQTSFRDYEVFAPGLSSGSGVNIIEALHLAELADFRKFGRPTQSAESLFRLIQIVNCRLLSDVLQDNAKAIEGRDLSPQSRATKETSQWIWDQMRAGQWMLTPGKVSGDGGPAGKHTAGVVAVDQWGNVVALTHSSNSSLWGETGIIIDGIPVPDSASFQQSEVKRAGPGGRLPNDMVPLIVLRQGRPAFACSAIGGGLHEKTITALIDVLEFGIEPAVAAKSPAPLLPAWENGPVAQVRKGDYSSGLLEAVRKRGQSINVLNAADADEFEGTWTGIWRNPQSGLLQGGSEVAGCVLPR